MTDTIINPFLNINSVDILTNPNNILFWAFWVMTLVAILIKTWNPIMRYKYRIETNHSIKTYTDKELQESFAIIQQVNSDMKRKYPNHKAINESYEIDLQKEYTKRFGSIPQQKSENVK